MQRTIDNMIAAMRAAPGVGLSANQIGIPMRVCHTLFDARQHDTSQHNLHRTTSVVVVLVFSWWLDEPMVLSRRFFSIWYLQIIVLEDTEEYIRMSDRKEVEQQQRVPFSLQVRALSGGRHACFIHVRCAKQSG